MTYIKTLWKDGVSLIDAEKMNKLEEGVRKNNADITETNTKFDRRVDETNTNLNNLSTSTDRRFQEANDRMNVFDETLEGNFVTCNNTIDSIVKKVVVLGKSYQNPSNLDEIKASGIDNGDGTFTYKISSCGKNLCKEKQIEITGFNNWRPYRLPINIDKTKQQQYTLSYKLKASVLDINPRLEIRYTDGTVTKASVVTTTEYTEQVLVSENGKAINYIGITFSKASDNCVFSAKDIQLELGTQATPKEEYKEDVVTITLPCQLEEHDQLYYDTKEEAWCVAKYNTLYTFTGAENIIARQDILVSERSAFGITGVGENTSKAMISKFRYLDDDSDVEHFRQGDEENSIVVFVNKSSLDVNSVEGFRSWMLKVGLYMKYPASTPNKIVLPKDVQIQLNQYLGTTNAWISSGDVGAKLKLTFNKSLGSVVQANAKEIEVLDSRIANIEGLKTSQDMAYSAMNGSLVCKNTKNGVVKDLKMYGKSILNHYSKSKTTPGTGVNTALTTEEYYTKTFPIGSAYPQISMTCSDVRLEAGETYTFYYPRGNNEGILIRDTDNAVNLTTNIDNDCVAITMKNTINKISFYLTILNGGGASSTVEWSPKLYRSKLLILEGDHTKNPPKEYFENIASVGSGVDEMEIVSYGKNLLDISKPVVDEKNRYGYFKLPKTNNNVTISLIDKDSSLPLGNAYLGLTKTGVDAGNGNEITWAISNGQVTTSYPKNYNYVSFFPNNIETLNLILKRFDIMVNLGDVAILYEPYKGDKKTPLFKDTDGTWKPIPVLHGKWKDGKFLWGDTVELHPDGKYYWHKRCGKDVLDGTQKVVIGTVMEKTCSFNVNLSKKTLDNSTKIISTRYKVTTDCYREDIEGMYGVGSYVYMRLDKTVVNTAEGMKSFLQANPVEVVYLLEEEEVYEVNFLAPSSFEGDTLVCCNSGVVGAPMEFKLTSNITNFISSMDRRLDFLEENFHKQNLAMLTIGLNTLNNKLELKSQPEPQNV